MATKIKAVIILFILAFSTNYPDDELMIKIEKKLDGLNSFSADFVQTYRVEALDSLIVEKGKLLVLKPGRMRWDYKSPDEKLFICDGEKIYFYVPEDKQVMVGEIDELNEQTAMVSILTGKSSLSKHYSCELIEEKEGEYILRFSPLKSDSTRYQRFLMNVTTEKLLVTRLAYFDNAGNLNEIKFTDIKINKNIKEKLFEFKVPKGVEVISSNGFQDGL